MIGFFFGIQRREGTALAKNRAGPERSEKFDKTVLEQNIDKQANMKKKITLHKNIAYRTLQVIWTANIPALLIGKPQTGKTSTIRQFFKLINAKYSIKIPSQMEPTDLMGILTKTKFEPEPGTIIETAQNLPPIWLAELNYYANMGYRTAIFIDEFRNMRPAMQAAALGIIFDGICGTYKLNSNIRRIAATNTLQDCPDGTPLSPPMSSRFVHIDWDNLIDDYKDFIENFPTYWNIQDDEIEDPDYFTSISESIGLDVLDKIPQDIRTTSRLIVAGFLKEHKEFYKTEVKEDEPWPGRRTWYIFSRLLASLLAYDEDLTSEQALKDIQMYLHGIGVPEAIGAFQTYIKNIKIPAIEEILHNPKILPIEVEESHILYLAYQKLKTYLLGFVQDILIRGQKQKFEEFKTIHEMSWKVQEYLQNNGVIEYAAALGHVLLTLGKQLIEHGYVVTYSDGLSRMAKLYSDAGLLKI